MTPSDLIYDHVFKDLVNLGFTQAHSEEAATEAVRSHNRNTRHKDAIKQAISQCKKLHKGDLK
jgi:Holliday junction resolvasome RuvABC DNA-binding subunit